jgi:hypothetical protein
MTAPTGTLPRKNYSRFGLAAVAGIGELSDRTGMVVALGLEPRTR